MDLLLITCSLENIVLYWKMRVYESQIYEIHLTLKHGQFYFLPVFVYPKEMHKYYTDEDHSILTRTVAVFHPFTYTLP
jgi:5-formyltetrahydrofolate cyclo-ligase